MNPLITILIPTVGRKSLAPAIDSVNRQTVPCSYIVEWDKDGIGAGPTMNRGLLRVQTPWAGNLDDDDLLDPRYVELFLETLAANPLEDMIIFRMQRIVNGVPKVLPPAHISHPAELMYGNVGKSFALRTELARRYGYIKAERDKGIIEDWEMIDTVRAVGHTIVLSPHVGYHVNPSDFAE